jgi:ribosomal protein L34
MLGKFKKRKRLRVHGFLQRTIDGWKVLRNRRRKWRYELTVSYPKRFQEVNWKAKMHIIAWGSPRKARFDGKGNYIK